MRSSILTPLLLAVVTLVGCAGIQVSQDYDPEVRSYPHATWQWRDAVQPPTGDLRADNPLLDKRIRRAIETHLAGRGIQLTRERSDLKVAYHLSIQHKIKSETYYSGMGGSYFYPWYWDRDVETTIYQVDQVRLTIDMMAADTGRLLWRGTGIYRYKTYATPEAAAADMQRIVDLILSPFPPTVP